MSHGSFSFLALFLLACSGDLSQPSACKGFADRELGITAEEYRPCAGQILAALDSLQPHLEFVVFDSAKGPEREAAGRAFGRLRTLVRQTGIEDDYRSFRPGTEQVKWPDRDVSAFNHAVFQATIQYMAVLAHPNEDNFGQGKKAHEEAQRFYRQIE
jgi:hypothetical protein